jgi:hypothetical protein
MRGGWADPGGRDLATGQRPMRAASSGADRKVIFARGSTVHRKARYVLLKARAFIRPFHN